MLIRLLRLGDVRWYAAIRIYKRLRRKIIILMKTAKLSNDPRNKKQIPLEHT